LLFEGAPDWPAPDRWAQIIEKHKVTTFYTAPTAIRMFEKYGVKVIEKYKFESLQLLGSVGEPIDESAWLWYFNEVGKGRCPIVDTWWQTETGGIMIANRPGLEIKLGSMGRPVEGNEAAIIADDGELLGSNQQGNLCLKRGWPSMFVSYLNNDMIYSQKFHNGYYYTGDKSVRDDDGYYWFKGRSDDVINTAGHLVSPFEIESALLEIKEVVESGVIGAPDEILFEKVVAFIKLRSGCVYNKDLELKIRVHIANKVSTIATPQAIVVVECIPKTKSGKIMRRVLKANYLGEDAGDLSTLEEF
jgi:acetyl-CoA synthetase